MAVLRFHSGQWNLFRSKFRVLLLVLFLIVFPKGGIKIADIPLTWGYLLLGLFAWTALLRVPVRVHHERLIAFLCTVPFQMYCAAMMFIYGTSSLGAAISFWTNFLFLPFTFYLLFSNDIDTIDLPYFFKLFKNGVFCIAAYGIFLFFVKQVTGKFIEIPLLTTNLGDLGGLENKHIDRGMLFKLISTYNNGNVFGVCMVILLPLYCLLEQSRWRNFVVKLSLILTCSRTVWVGLVVHELVYPCLTAKRIRDIITPMLTRLSIFAGCLAVFMIYYGFNFGFLMDRNLGGRKDSLDGLGDIHLLASEPFGGISEIIYAGVVSSLGWMALPLFLFGLCAPLLYQLFSRRLDMAHKCIALGLCNYLFVACSDGAILLIPTLAFYWFFLSLLHRQQLAQCMINLG